ncbi:MAG: hypothetical protein ACLTMP_03755 [Eggerthella lenta]
MYLKITYDQLVSRLSDLRERGVVLKEAWHEPARAVRRASAAVRAVRRSHRRRERPVHHRRRPQSGHA